MCCGLWGRKESDMTEQLNSTELNLLLGNGRIHSFEMTLEPIKITC